MPTITWNNPILTTHRGAALLIHANIYNYVNENPDSIADWSWRSIDGKTALEIKVDENHVSPVVDILLDILNALRGKDRGSGIRVPASLLNNFSRSIKLS